jgi:hypothetical protein
MEVPLDWNCVPRKADTQAGREMLPGEALVVDCSTATYRSLNETASFLWERIDACRSLEDLFQDFQETFEVDEETARRDIQEFICLMLEKKMILCP